MHNAIINILQSDEIANQMEILKNYDKDTYQHAIRTAEITMQLANKMDVNTKDIETIITAALLHDIGKIYIPTDILRKPSKLTSTEYAIIKTHPEKGVEHLATAGFDENIQDIVGEHHENFDGSGYPNHKTSKQLHPLSGIIRIADSIDAMRSKRIYKQPMSLKKVKKELKDNSRHYDPRILTYI